jgi:hypothetical protein
MAPHVEREEERGGRVLRTDSTATLPPKRGATGRMTSGAAASFEGARRKKPGRSSAGTARSPQSSNERSQVSR